MEKSPFPGVDSFPVKRKKNQMCNTKKKKTNKKNNNSQTKRFSSKRIRIKLFLEILTKIGVEQERGENRINPTQPTIPQITEIKTNQRKEISRCCFISTI